MRKIALNTLGLIVTNKCNLDCAHCMRGCKNGNEMIPTIVDFTLEQICCISNLAICGGEPTLALPIIEYIFNSIINNHIVVDEVTTTINGTIYSEELLRLFDYINDYMKIMNKKNNSNIKFFISLDKYHLYEIDKLGLLDTYKENTHKYSESIHFYGLQGLNKKLKLFREGNASRLPDDITVPIKPIPILVTYAGKRGKFDRENGICNIGPIITVDTDGIITDCDASIENQKSIYNYGNVLRDSIEEVALKKGKVLKPREWYRQGSREIKKHNSYNK